MKKTLLIALLAASQFAFAQNPKAARNSALIAYDDYTQDTKANVLLLGEAKKHSDLAITDPSNAIDPKTWMNRGQIYSALGNDDTWKTHAIAKNNWVEALSAFNKAMELDVKKKVKKEINKGVLGVLGGLYNSGVESFNQKDYERSFLSFSNIFDAKNTLNTYLDGKLSQEELLATQIDFDLAAYLAGISAAQLNKGLEAEKYLLPLTEKDATKMNKNIRFAQIYTSLYDAFKATDNAKAKKHLSEGRKKFPDNQDILIKNIQIAQEDGKIGEMESDMLQAIKNDPKNASLHFVLGTVYGNLTDDALKKGDTKATNDYIAKAKGAYEGAIALNDPNYGTLARYNLAAMLLNKGVVIHKELDAITDMKKYATKKTEVTPQITALCTEASNHMTEANKTSPSPEIINALSSIYMLWEVYDKSPEVKAKAKEYSDKKNGK
jgi:hypothetical protein